MRRLSLLMFLALASCCTVRSVVPVVIEDDATIRVWIVSVDEKNTSGKKGGVFLSFTLTGSDDWSHIVQEVFLDSGETLVEAFTIDEYIGDHHTWSNETHYRHMRLYAADVCGMDETSKGWGELPDNGIGLKSTTDPKIFNEEYAKNGHKRMGVITRRSPNVTEWYIDDVGAKVKVGGSVTWTR